MPEALHESVVMGGEEHPRALALQRKKQVQQAAGGGGIHAAGRLVSKNEARTSDDRPSNRNALPLAARETVRQSPLPPGKTDQPRSSSPSARASRSSRPAMRSGRQTFSNAESQGTRRKS